MDNLAEPGLNFLPRLTIGKLNIVLRYAGKNVDPPFVRHWIKAISLLIDINLDCRRGWIIPSDFFDEQLLEIECLEADNYTCSIDWHVLLFDQSHGTDDLRLTLHIIFVDITKHIGLVQGQYQFR